MDEINVKVSGFKVTTVTIDYRNNVGFLYRCRVLPALILRPYRMAPELFLECSAMGRLKVANTFYQRFRFFADHFIFWPWYCIKATITGRARGYSWVTRWEQFIDGYSHTVTLTNGK